ncbi:MAG: hypothetical protein K9L78_01305 [Victivallales bacterium]|nr:hypothetical protein [Victivallales bacterium]
MKLGILKFSSLNLAVKDIPKLRGFVSGKFSQYDILHNHKKNGKVIARYPLIQFKIIDKSPVIIAITDKAIDIFSEIFLKLDEIDIAGTTIPVYEKDLKIENFTAGYSRETFVYQFTSPWLALNQDNYAKYRTTESFEEKQILLESILTRNIQSMSGGIGIWLEKKQRIKTKLKFRKTYVKLKGNTMSGFLGTFKTNYIIPDYLGLGKSTSRGFGTVKKLL